MNSVLVLFDQVGILSIQLRTPETNRSIHRVSSSKRATLTNTSAEPDIDNDPVELEYFAGRARSDAERETKSNKRNAKATRNNRSHSRTSSRSIYLENKNKSQPSNHDVIEHVGTSIALRMILEVQRTIETLVRFVSPTSR